jgi:hypothetical protein
MEVLVESQARRKLREAHYFLQQVSICAESLDEEKFWYNLSAFVSAWISVREYLLYDYAEKLGLGFTRDENMTVRDFEVAARAKNNAEAQQLLSWWKESGGKLDGKLKTKRKYLLHRGYQDDVRKEFVSIEEFSVPASTPGVSGYMTEVLNAFAQRLASTAGSIPQPPAVAGTRIVDSKTIPTLKTYGMKYEFRFADYPDVNAVDVCKRAYGQAEQIVSEAEDEVWKQK